MATFNVLVSCWLRGFSHFLKKSCRTGDILCKFLYIFNTNQCEHIVFTLRMWFGVNSRGVVLFDTAKVVDVS